MASCDFQTYRAVAPSEHSDVSVHDGARQWARQEALTFLYELCDEDRARVVELVLEDLSGAVELQTARRIFHHARKLVGPQGPGPRVAYTSSPTQPVRDRPRGR